MAESLLDPENLKKIGWLASASAAIVGFGSKFIATKSGVKKVDDDLQSHKNDDLKKHEERMDFLRRSHGEINGNVLHNGVVIMERIKEYQGFVENQISGVRQSIEKPFQQFVDLATKVAVLEVDLEVLLADVERVKKELAEKKAS